MQQKTLCVAPITLFSVEDSGKSVSKGNCACALVALPGVQPKYSIVCYTAASSTLCVARLESRNERGARVLLQKSGQIDFMDDSNKRWSALFNNEGQRENFVAQVTLAFYLMNGRPPRAAVQVDLTFRDVGIPLGLHHRASVFYRAYQTKESDGILEISRMVEKTDDRPYAFTPLQSNVVLPAGYKGFESEVLRMTEGAVRGVTVPYDTPSASSDDILIKQSALPTVFVVSLQRLDQLDFSRGESSLTPTVFAATDDPPRIEDNAARGDASDRYALVPSTYADPTHTNLVAPYSPDVVASPSSLGGIPPEQMTLLQKVGVGIGNLTLNVSDLQTIIETTSSNFHSKVKRPPPTRLTNKELSEQVQLIISENEGSKAELSTVQESVFTIEKDNTDLQKRIDDIGRECQDLINGRVKFQDSVRDSRLEKSRLILKLQDQVEIATTQRDDVERHVNTLKKLVDVSKEELRQVQARQGLLEIQRATDEEQASVAEATLQETRTECASLEALLTELRAEEEGRRRELRSVTAQLQEVELQAERERSRCYQLAQEERTKREADVREIRTEMMNELKSKEIRYRAEHSRIVEEKYYAGREEGKRLGREAALEDVALHLQSLRLDLQRAQSAVDVRKDELRDRIAESISSRRMRLSQAEDLRKSIHHLIKEKVAIDIKTGKLESGRCGRGAVLRDLSLIVKQLDHPVEASQMLTVVDSLERGDRYIDLSFNQENWKTTMAAVCAQRVVWIEEVLFDIYRKGMEYYYQEWMKPLEEVHQHTTRQVKLLWVSTYGESHYAVVIAERKERFAIESERQNFFDMLVEWRRRDAAAREAMWSEAASTAEELYQHATTIVQQLYSICVGQLQQRQTLRDAETAGRRSITLEENAGRCLLPEVFRDWSAQMLRDAQGALIQEEEYERATREAEEVAQFGALRIAAQLATQRLEEESLRTGQQEELAAMETRARALLHKQEALGRTALLEWLVEALSAPTEELPPLSAHEEQPPVVTPPEPSATDDVPPPLPDADSAPPPPVVERAELRTPPPKEVNSRRPVDTPPPQVSPSQLPEEPPPLPSDSDEEPAAAPARATPIARNPVKVEAQSAPREVVPPADSSDEDDGEVGKPSKKALFGDSESDSEGPPPLKKRAAQKKKTKTTKKPSSSKPKLFDSDDD